MLIKRIKAKNFKTYLDLDLDITVQPDKPIILVGGANGGGKTTFFEAIYGALYGLKMHTAQQFKELVNAGAEVSENLKIELEIQFTGKVLNEEQQYVITRTYMLNTALQPVESVRLNMNGSIFNYGTATPPAQRAEQEAQVNKIIKANLPQELSRYFLFDAMEAGNLLKEDQLNRVIKENIENVMGFNKYMYLAKSSESLFQSYTAQRLQIENEKQEYLQLVAQKKEKEEQLNVLDLNIQDALSYAVTNKEIYDNLKSGINQETTIKNKIEQTQVQIENIYKKEAVYRTEIDELVKDIEINVFLPKLLEELKQEITLILKVREESQIQNNLSVSLDQVETISSVILNYLTEHQLTTKDVSLQELVDAVLASANTNQDNTQYDFLEFSEVKALEALVNLRATNTFPMLNQQKQELEISINQIASLEYQIEQMKAQITGRDYTLLKAYEDNEASIKANEIKATDLKLDLANLDKKIHQFDIQMSQDPDPKYDTLAKLKSFFEDVANKLLKVKKQQIEVKMKSDLNINLIAYRDVIDRVELSESLTNLTFKIYHKSGNEIYLNHLNTASKQIVVQVLLKALHEYGDYDPPVMIDTVMGVLDEQSRSTVLENYFPELAYQTILLSSDSEIRPETDYQRIAPFIAKTYTLKRNKEQQSTEVSAGYFGLQIEN